MAQLGQSTTIKPYYTSLWRVCEPRLVPETAHALARESPSISAGLRLLTGSGEEEEEEEEESLFKADAVNEEDSERDRATQV